MVPEYLLRVFITSKTINMDSTTIFPIATVIAIVVLLIFQGSNTLDIKNANQRITDLDATITGNVIDRERSHNRIHRERGAYITYLHQCMDRTGTKYLSELEWSEKQVLDQVFETSNSRI